MSRKKTFDLTSATALIKRFEGLSLTAYQCSAGVWTIGYGHTGGVHQGDVITQEQADALLEQDISTRATGLTSILDKAGAKVTEPQFNALLSLGYNIGLTALSSSTLMSHLAAGRTEQAAGEFSRWIYSGGKILPGLVTRRAEERALFEGTA